jgi:hypothetical protein
MWTILLLVYRGQRGYVEAKGSLKDLGPRADPYSGTNPEPLIIILTSVSSIIIVVRN